MALTAPSRLATMEQRVAAMRNPLLGSRLFAVWLLLGFAKLWAGAQMLTKIDQNTIGKMTAALECVCKKIATKAHWRRHS